MGSSIAVNISSWINNQLEMGMIKGTATSGDPLSYSRGEQSFHLLMKGLGALVAEGFWIGREDLPPSNAVVKITLLRSSEDFDQVEFGLHGASGLLQVIRLRDTRTANPFGRVAFMY